MRIKEQEIGTLPISEVIELLKDCHAEPDISRYEKRFYQSPERDPEESALDDAFFEEKKDYIQTQKQTHLDKAFELVHEIIRRSRDSENDVWLAFGLGHAADLARRSGDMEQAYEYKREAAIASRRADGFIDHWTVEDLAETAIGKAINGNPPEELFDYIKDALRADKNPKKMHPQLFDKPAYNVEQHEVGFSSDAPLSTNGVGDCVVIMLRDPLTHKTALAHVDYRVTPDSILSMYDHIYAGNTLEMRIQGASSMVLGQGEAGLQAHAQKGNDNLAKILQNFLDKDINLVSANIGEHSNPSVTIPKDGENK